MSHTKRLHSLVRRNPYLRYISEFSDLKGLLSLANAFAIIQAVSLIPMAIFFKKIVDTYIPNEDARAILNVIMIGILLWGVHIVATVAGRYFTLKATKTVTERLRARLTMKLQQMSLRFYDNEKVGDLHARVILDTERVDVMANCLVVHILVSVVVAITATTVLVYVNPKLFLLLFLMLPFYFIIRRGFAQKLKDGHGNFRKDMEQMSSIVSDVLHSIRLVKSFAMERFEQKRVEERIQQVTNRGVRLFTEAAAFQILLQCVGGMAMLAIFTVGGWMVISKHLTVGDVIAFSSLTAYFLNPINTIISSMDVLYAGRAGLVSVYGLLDIYDTEDSEHLPKIQVQGNVTFQDVSFQYNEDARVLNGISFDARPGEQFALVGASGAGKTTLVNLILGFYLPTSGRVLIDGHDLREIRLRNLREQIGVVSQDNVLIGGTILNNIKYGKINATQPEIEAAAKLANAHEFILDLPNGYESEIGDKGIRLSGGQKQRIAIARAVLKDPRILILDEATSALDSESERVVQEAMEQLRTNRTSFIIAHRLSTIQNADKIIVLGNGKVLESGSFEELIARRGEFYRYYNVQFGRRTEGLQIPA